MHKLIRNRRGSDSTNKTNIFTAHKRSLGKVIFSEACACVSHSVGEGGHCVGRGICGKGLYGRVHGKCTCDRGVCMAGVLMQGGSSCMVGGQCA